MAVLAPVCAGLAQGKQQMVVVPERTGLVLQQAFHGRDLHIGEAVGLEIGKTPIGFTLAAAQLNTLFVGGDSLVHRANRPQGVPIAQVSLPVGRVLRYDTREQGNRAGMVIDIDKGCRLERQPCCITGITVQQHAQLRQSFVIAMTLVEHIGQRKPGYAVIGRELHAARQQVLGVSQCTQRQPQLAEHANAIHIAWMIANILTKNGLCERQLSRANVAGSRDQFRRKLARPSQH